MASISWYWTLIQLKPSGSYGTYPHAPARLFLQQHCPELLHADSLDTGVDRHLQHQLMIYLDAAVASPPGTGAQPGTSQAERCLRCYISHQILHTCLDLQARFGQDHGFSLNDVLGFVLNDVDLTQPLFPSRKDAYRPFAAEILRTFNSQASSLATWASMLTRQHTELNDFLLEYGILQQSNWALLNGKSPDDLRRILRDTFNLPTFEVEQACTLLSSYHAVYRRDRRGRRGKCKPPSELQLDAIRQRSGLALSPAAVLAKLIELADYLRQYQLMSRGVLRGVSMDEPEMGPGIESRVSSGVTANDAATDETTQRLYGLVKNCLEQAIQTAIDQRLAYLQRQSPKNVELYRRALKLYCCEQRTMADIAIAVGLNAQWQVTRLLKVDDLIAAIRRQLVLQLKASILALTQTEDLSPDYLCAERLRTLDENHLATIIEKPRANASVTNDSNRFFLQQLCGVIQRL